MKRIACIAFVVAMGLAAPVLAGPFESALFATQKGAFATALRLWRPLADQGNASAQFNLGDMYARGQGTPQDYAEAIRWYRKAADQGHADAQHTLAFMYDNGEGAPQDYAEAIGWYRKAAENGVADVYSRLGFMYEQGLGTAQDHTEAIRWYRKGADQGDAAAQNNLGLMYKNGEGVPQDYVQAHKWLGLAASLFPASDKELRDLALRNRDRAAADMTPAQIAEAEKLTREWKPASPANVEFWTVTPPGKTRDNLPRDLRECRLRGRNGPELELLGGGTTGQRMIAQAFNNSSDQAGSMPSNSNQRVGQAYLAAVRDCMIAKGYR